MKDYQFKGKEVSSCGHWIEGCLTQSFEGGIERAMIRERRDGATWRIVDPETVVQVYPIADEELKRLRWVDTAVSNLIAFAKDNYDNGGKEALARWDADRGKMVDGKLVR